MGIPTLTKDGSATTHACAVAAPAAVPDRDPTPDSTPGTLSRWPNGLSTTFGNVNWRVFPKSRTSCIASFRTKSTATEFRSALIRHRQLSRVSPARRLRILVNCHPVLITGNENKKNKKRFLLSSSTSTAKAILLSSSYFFKSSSHWLHTHIGVKEELKKSPFGSLQSRDDHFSSF